MQSIGLLGIFCGIGVAMGLFLTTYFLFIQEKKKQVAKLLGLIFIAVSLRIAKSIWFFILIDVAPIGLAMGFLGLSSFGPLLFTYINSFRAPISKKVLLHAILPIIFTILCFFLHLGWVTVFYKSATALAGIYLISAWYMHAKTSYNRPQLAQWNLSVLIGLSIIWASFVYQHLGNHMIEYAIGAAIASIPIYYLLIIAMRQTKLWVQAPPKIVPDEINLNLQKLIEQEKTFLQPQLSLNSFAEAIGYPAYQVSKAVNILYGKSFPETINSLRIEEVKKRLLDPANSRLKIEALAYDVGFNSPSAFYAAFKKETGMTPKAYQRAGREKTPLLS
jgi:AraC-like DNA-binding protein